MLDFKKKLSEKENKKNIDPLKIYDDLDRTTTTKTLTPIQIEVLNKWFRDRNKKNNILKLHTGQGKTIVGLLILQSYINSNDGPCMYVCPNRYLAKQVCNEADKFGVKYCTINQNNEIPEEYTSGEKILIVHVQKIFNGVSKFSKRSSINQKNGRILLDDSHSCIDAIKDTFSISIKKSKNIVLYNKILALFSEDLKQQGEGTLMDLTDGEKNILAAVPYWAFKEKRTELLRLLSDNKEDNSIKFSWDIIKDSLDFYTCYFSGEEVEISCDFPDIEKYPVFAYADSRILMSATTQDDSFFIKGLNFDIETVKNPLISDSEKWSGEKMILMPSKANDFLDRDKIITEFSKKINTNFGMVALVPGTSKLKQYEVAGADIVTSDNINHKIEKLKNKDFNKLTVFNNRYDGIDLPDEMCRILILDSLPYLGNLSDKYEEYCRPYSDILNKKIAQKIEQGLGRAVRGEKDYCVIIIIGTDLLRFINENSTKKLFSNQTIQQINIGQSITDMLKEENKEIELGDIGSLIKQSLDREDGWKTYYNAEMDKMSYENNYIDLTDRLQKEKEIDRLYINGEYQKACDKLQKYIDDISDEREKSWYMQQLARIYYKIDKIKSNEIQISAFKLNKQLLKPKDGIKYQTISYINEHHISRVKKYINKHKSYELLKLKVDEILDNLSFGVESEKFENALKEIGELLGFISERPDLEIKKGPDNLWCGVDNKFLIFECKNNVNESRDKIHKEEAGQMNNHCGWFENEYGKDKEVSIFMVIPTINLSYHANFTHDVRIIRKNKLRLLKSNIRSFINALHSYQLESLSNETLNECLEANKLLVESFEETYSEKYRHLRV